MRVSLAPYAMNRTSSTLWRHRTPVSYRSSRARSAHDAVQAVQAVQAVLAVLARPAAALR
jgi:hypothetical protein